ncbi:sugar phosphate isomerase/epimerase [Clostridium sp. WLY-B-L2]|uniref:Sugar phosphate isomerase/epimerase n=1 Tax=Clostridium aromativorans TaxID=2836848 RepID=A0ABS8N763_9CLOT|nr:TIM barrel protein [Clostridium aromativorans]MCC9295658.1 sugar phosphate isomerase/epimerase [Clostridium aromativorans]CAB1249961.1 Xylose isomerase-like TIM barrel [Clostridiaceae bacterium BL-3]
MDKKLVVINTLVFKNYMEKGFKQEEIFEYLNELNLSNIEIRREFIRNFSTELEMFSKLSKKFGINTYYSVPKYLFIDGEVNKKNILKYIEEAKKFNCKSLKLNIGDYRGYAGNLKEDLRGILDTKISINIENDQSVENGTCKNIIKFLEDCKKENIDIGYVYDIGNWSWINEDEMENAKLLKDFTRHIHLKDVKRTSDGLRTVLLNEGNILWKEVLDIFPKDIPVSLEYPCEDFSVIKEEIKKVLEY